MNTDLCILLESYQQDIINCTRSLEKGESILYPTDTIWGLGCDATNELAVDKISLIKNRPKHKSYIVLMSDAQMLRNYLINPIQDLELFLEQQKGATTIIYNQIKGIAANALAEDGSVGIRIPKDDFCLSLIRHFKKPILSTSANLSGESNPSFYNEIAKTIVERSHYVCNWRQDDETPKQPSNIIKLNDDGTTLKIR